LKYTVANYNGEPRDIPKYLFSDLIKRQLALSNYNEIEIDLFTKFMSVKMTKQHIFVIENNLQKVGVIFALSDNRGTRSTCPTSVFTGIRQTLMSRPVTDKKHRFPLKYTVANYNGEPRDIPKYLFSDLIKRQLALSNYNEIEIDLFIVFPSSTQ
jgi:hypothetical protein